MNGNTSGADEMGNYEMGGGGYREISFDEDVESFLINLHDFVYQRNAEALRKLFDNDFHVVSGIYFKDRRWPSIKLVDDFYKEKNRFHNLIHSLYEELYYRHVFIIHDVKTEDRINAWNNYKCLLNFIAEICTESDDPSDPNDNILVMPNGWIYDFLFEYTYQYQSMCHLRVEVLKQPEVHTDLINAIIQCPDVFESNIVLEQLHNLLVKGDFLKYSEEERTTYVNNVFTISNEEITCKYQFGYFACCILLNVYVLLGDYHTALKIISYIEINHKALYWKVPVCHIYLFYNISFCFLMLRRYNDCIKIVSQVLYYISKHKSVLANIQGYQQNLIQKLNEKMYLMVIICHSLTNIKLDDVIMQNIKENYSSKFYAILTPNEDTYVDLFLQIAPKFIDPISNTSFLLLVQSQDETQQTYISDPTLRQMYIFIKDVAYQRKIARYISYAKLYHNIQLTKLSDLMNSKEGETDYDEEAVCADIMSVKRCSKQLVWKGGPLYKGEYVISNFFNAFDFFIDIDILNIKAKTQEKVFVDYFMHQIGACKNILNFLKGVPKTPILKGGKGVATQKGKKNMQKGKGKLTAGTAGTGGAPGGGVGGGAGGAHGNRGKQDETGYNDNNDTNAKKGGGAVGVGVGVGEANLLNRMKRSNRTQPGAGTGVGTGAAGGENFRSGHANNVHVMSQ